MSDAERMVLAALRSKLHDPGGAAAFVADLEGRVRQLLGGMVDGRVLPKPEADALRVAIIELVRTEALATLRARRPDDAIAVLDKLKAYGWTALETERASLKRERTMRHAPPPAASWPELSELSDLDELGATSPGVDNVSFADALRDAGLPLPDDLLALYAAHDGFDLACSAGSSRIPVFSLLPSGSIDTSDASDGYPRRAVCFEGGDGVHLAVFRADDATFWVVYEADYEPVAKKPFALRELLRFALERMRASSIAALFEGELSWERYFGLDAE